MIINQIFNKLQLLTASESELAERLEELEIISSLRGKRIEKLITKQKETMPIIIDIRKTLRFKQGKSEGLMLTAEKMLKDGVHIPLVHKYTGIPIIELKKLAEKMPEIN